jgi:thioredoxin-like negative regulator of GroEL
MYPDEMTTPEQVTDFIKKETAVLLYFYSDSCAPCLSLRPKVVELICDSFPEIKIAFINGENEPMIPAKFGAFSFPTLLIFFEGKEYIRESKYVAIPQLAASISRPYKLLFEI